VNSTRDHDRLGVERLPLPGPLYPGEPQPDRALRLANEVRLAGARLRREIQKGGLPALDALTHVDAAHLPLERVVMARQRWGRTRMRRALRSAGLPDRTEARRCDELTERQVETLAAELEARGW
jgi:hypothetical protein